MDINGLVSVIIPVYNVEQYVAKCITSVMCQTYSQLEIIIVDDGSTDQGGILCDTYAGKDSRITVYHKENGGLSDARNYGLDHCKGDYIFFLDSDDYIAETAIEHLLCALAEAEADLAVCNYQWMDEAGNLLEQSSFTNQILSQEELMDAYLLVGHPSVVWNKLYRAEIFEELRFPKGRIHEDEFTTHYIYDKCKKAVFISESLYYYIKRQDSIVNKAITEREFDVVDAFFDRYQFCRNKGAAKYYWKTAWQVWNAMEDIIERIGWKQISPSRRRELRRIYKAIYRDLVRGHRGTGLEYRRSLAFRISYMVYRLERNLE